MFRICIVVIVATTVAASAIPQDAKPTAKPPYERLLQGADAKKASELQRQFEDVWNKDREAAIHSLEQLLELRERVQGRDHWEAVSARELLRTRRSIAALSPDSQLRWQKSKEELSKALNVNRGEQLKLVEQHVRTCEDLLGKEHSGTGDMYYLLGLGLFSDKQFAAAAIQFERSLEIRVKVFGENHPLTNDSLSYLSVLLLGQKKLKEAKAGFQRSLAICQFVHGSDHVATADSFELLGVCNNDLFALEEAEPLFLEALRIRILLQGEDHLQTARCHKHVADLLGPKGKYAEVEQHLRKALKAFSQNLGDSDPEVAACSHDLACCLASLDRHAEARSHFQRALDIRRSKFGEEHLDTAESYHYLGISLRNEGDNVGSAEMVVKALLIRQKLLGDKSEVTAESYAALAHGYQLIGRFADAEKLYKEVIRIMTQIEGRERPDKAAALIERFGELAVNQCLLGKFAEAEKLMRIVVRYDVQTRRRSHSTRAWNLRILGVALSRQGKHGEASEVFNLAIQSYDLHRVLPGRASDRATRSPDPRAELLSTQTEHDPALAWKTAESSFARGLLDAHFRDSTFGLSVDEKNNHRQWQNEIASIQPEIVKLAGASGVRDADVEKRFQALLGRSRQAENSLLESLARASERQVEVLHRVQESLESDAALVFWVSSFEMTNEHEHWGCVVRNTGVPRWVKLPTKDWDKAFPGTWTQDEFRCIRLRSAFSGDSASKYAAEDIQFVRQYRIEPLLPHLQGTTRLYVVPVDEMADMPMDVLLPDHAISYVPSGTMLARIARKQSLATGRLLLLGDPIFHRDARQVEPHNARPRDDWSELPGSRAELAEISRIYEHSDRVTLLLDSTASEQSLDELRRRGDLSKFRYLHFATHGQGDHSEAFQSALILSQDKLPADPMPRTGQPVIDGQVTAQEVLDHWKLDAELVTLSACESAIGPDGKGEGTLGFARAFLTAGARAVCLSLWKVDDRATALLMGRFYQNLLGKRSGLEKPLGKAAALHEAKRWLRELTADEVRTLTAAATRDVVRLNRGKGEILKPLGPAPDTGRPPEKTAQQKPFADPRYWAAFILIGDPN